jgi:hypothetical protein
VTKVLLCSNCFVNEGLRRETQKVGTVDGCTCPNCGSVDGSKVDLEALNAAVDRFFVLGTKPSIYSVPVIIKQRPDYPLSPGWDNDLDLDKATQRDYEVIKKASGIGLMLHGPRLSRLGLTSHEEGIRKALRFHASAKGISSVEKNRNH